MCLGVHRIVDLVVQTQEEAVDSAVCCETTGRKEAKKKMDEQVVETWTSC